MSSRLKKIQKNILRKKFVNFVNDYNESFQMPYSTSSIDTDIILSPTMTQSSYRYHPTVYDRFTREERRLLQKMNLI